MTETTENPPRRKSAQAGWPLLPLLIFVGLAAVFAVQLLSGKDNSIIPSVLIGKQAPLTNLPPVEGLMRDGAPVSGFNSEDLKTGPGASYTLVNVWGSWCALPSGAPAPDGNRQGDSASAWLASLVRPTGCCASFSGRSRQSVCRRWRRPRRTLRHRMGRLWRTGNLHSSIRLARSSASMSAHLRRNR